MKGAGGLELEGGWEEGEARAGVWVMGEAGWGTGVAAGWAVQVAWVGRRVRRIPGGAALVLPLSLSTGPRSGWGARPGPVRSVSGV